jgi:uncharacterized protein YijF (DUF1287 family)
MRLGLFGAIVAVIGFLSILSYSSVAHAAQAESAVAPTPVTSATPKAKKPPSWANAKLAFHLRLAAAAEERAKHHVTYDGRYFRIPYPGGDVPAKYGVCTDEVVRSYRMAGVDLQKLVHEDMTLDFSVYPQKFGNTAPDPNIDHRRVGNLDVFFKRRAQVLPNSTDPKDYRPGDVIVWDLDNFQWHIGLVTRKKSKDGERLLILHNIASGPKIEDKLFYFPILGHYRFDGTINAIANTIAPVEVTPAAAAPVAPTAITPPPTSTDSPSNP